MRSTASGLTFMSGSYLLDTNIAIAKGRPIPENDIWIAATARPYDLILVTRDPHFNEVESLPTVAW